MTQIPETKEIATVKQQATKALGLAQEMVIASADDRVRATDVLSKMKTVAKMIKEREEAITKPLNEALSSARDLFRPMKQNLAEAESVVKTKMLAYDAAEEKRIAEEQQKIAEKVEAGKMKPETAMKKIENIGEVKTSVQGKVGQTQTRTVKKYRVVDESKIPREYLVPDMGKITEAFKAGKVVPGAEAYEEKIISAR